MDDAHDSEGMNWLSSQVGQTVRREDSGVFHWTPCTVQPNNVSADCELDRSRAPSRTTSLFFLPVCGKYNNIVQPAEVEKSWY